MKISNKINSPFGALVHVIITDAISLDEPIVSPSVYACRQREKKWQEIFSTAGERGKKTVWRAAPSLLLPKKEKDEGGEGGCDGENKRTEEGGGKARRASQER